MSSQFQLYQDNSGEFRWRLLAENHEIVAQSSQGYSNKEDAQRGIEIIRERGLSASPTIYQDDDGRFRFRVKAPNGNIIAAGQSYANEEDCSATVSLIQQLAKVAAVKDETS